ncbi:MAG: flagellar protein FlgN [Pseudomonadota bacterium]
MNAANPQTERLGKGIAQILKRSIDAASNLHAALELERESLEQQDLDGLERAMNEKAARLESLAELEQQRSALCREAGLRDDDPEQMHKLVAPLDERDAVAEQWQRLLELAAECQTLNLGNGSVIRIRQNQLGDRLAVLRGVSADGPSTYGKNGNGPAQAAQRSLAEA